VRILAFAKQREDEKPQEVQHGRESRIPESVRHVEVKPQYREVFMASYTVTNEPLYHWEEPHGRVFKYRHFSRNGSRVAQVEFDRRHDTGQHAVLTKWENNEPTIMERC
jgi:hypothetical protein